MDTNKASDNQLISSFQMGRQEAFVKLYTRYRDRAFFYALALTGNEYCAEEVVQDAFLVFLRKGRSYAAFGSFRSYLFAAIRSRSIDRLRKGKVRREVLKGHHLDLFENQKEETAEASDPERTAMVSAALMGLPSEQREVIVLKIYNDMTFSDIADLVGLSRNTVASRYRYGCDKLRAKLNGIKENG